MSVESQKGIITIDCVDSTLLVLNETSLSSDNALLVLGQLYFLEQKLFQNSNGQRLY